jgi:23S rRNA pseudouridine2605 synthase
MRRQRPPNPDGNPHARRGPPREGPRPQTGGRGQPPPQQREGESEKLHKVLARVGMGSRRSMEEVIASGRVSVNGRPAHIGMRVGPRDDVRLDGQRLRLETPRNRVRILLYHKPEGEIVTRSDPGNRITVFERLPPLRGAKWIAVGRLDINSSGLLIFTTEGELANRLMHPSFEVDREYAVRTMGQLGADQITLLTKGIELEDGTAHVDSLVHRGGEGLNQWYGVVLSEGRNREVRRLFEAVGLQVSRLIRVRYGKIEMPPRLKRGQIMELEPNQVQDVLRWVGLPDLGKKAADSRPPRRPRPPPRQQQRQPRFDSLNRVLTNTDRSRSSMPRDMDERAPDPARKTTIISKKKRPRVI